jgi:cobalt/nickel transport system permease protein
MHMADALLSPAVGGAMWAAAAATTVYCSTKLKNNLDDRKIPLMGVLAAFVFAAQMINFAIPGTGSSGHLGGGLLLAILLGPPAALLAIASVLTVQALFFADGGLLALGCNIFNLGVFPCFLAYPLIYKNIAGVVPTAGRLLGGALLAGVIALQLGSLGVVLETTLSGIAELPFTSFLLLMQPIHLAIGIVEGLVTAVVISFIWRARPEIITRAAAGHPLGPLPLRPVLITLVLATLGTGGFLSWFASAQPDGLEWSIFRVAGQEELAAPETGVHQVLEGLREKTALAPDYGFPAKPGAPDSAKLATSLAGIYGGLLVLLLTGLLGFALKRLGAIRAGGAAPPPMNVPGQKAAGRRNGG